MVEDQESNWESTERREVIIEDEDSIGELQRNDEEKVEDEK